MTHPHAWLLLALLTSSCGYSFGSGLPDQGIRTVHLRAPGNDTWRQRLEAELGATVARELPVSSDLVPASAAEADAELTIAIGDEHERTVVTGDRTAPVREGSQEASVRVVLTDRRTGRRLVDRVVADRAEFRDPIGENLTTARRELVDDLARKIILALETRF